VKPDPEWANGHRTGRGRCRRHLQGGHFGPNLATNPNDTHPGRRPPVGLGRYGVGDLNFSLGVNVG
jgi:hypothetical protein